MKTAAAAASMLQPTGYTLNTTRVKTKVPFLLKHKLREYQHIGLDWLVLKLTEILVTHPYQVMMYEKRLNGILADEMVSVRDSRA